jgi:hypothetical protein
LARRFSAAASLARHPTDKELWQQYFQVRIKQAEEGGLQSEEQLRQLQNEIAQAVAQNLLKPYEEFLYYIPSEKNAIIDIDVVATSEKSKDPFRNETLFQIISRINVFNKDITKQMSRYGIHGQNSFGLKEVLSNFLLAPKELINMVLPLNVWV